MKKTTLLKFSMVLIVILLAVFTTGSALGVAKITQAKSIKYYYADGTKVKANAQNKDYLKEAKKEIKKLPLKKGSKIYLNLNKKMQKKVEASGAKKALIIDAQTGKVLCLRGKINSKVKSSIVGKVNIYGHQLNLGKMSLGSIIKTKDGDAVLREYLKSTKNITEKVSMANLSIAAATVSNGGFKVQPHFVNKIKHKNKTVYAPKNRTQILKDDVAYLLADAIGNTICEDDLTTIFGSKLVGIFDKGKKIKIKAGKILKPNSVEEIEIDLNELENSGTVMRADSELESALKAKMLFSKRFIPPNKINKIEKPNLYVSANGNIATIAIETNKSYQILLYKNGKILKTLYGNSFYKVQEPIERGVEVVFEVVAKYGDAISSKQTKTVFINKEIKELTNKDVKEMLKI